MASGPGSKEYGILSVLLQSFFEVEYLFTVDEHVFTPPPKVKSGVLRMTRNQVEQLDCDERLFIRVVKAAFLHRRKTLRNSLRKLDFNHDAVLHLDRKSTRLNSSHVRISYAVFCLKKK